MDNFQLLRKKYPKFNYESFSTQKKDNDLEITFKFAIEGLVEFYPQIVIKNAAKHLEGAKNEYLDNFIFHLGLIELISYWKATCSEKIEIKCGKLTDQQISWWESLIENGLGEFFYQNKINLDEEKMVSLQCTSTETFSRNDSIKANRYLILNGGGRDSAVALELFQKSQENAAVFMLNPSEAAKNVAQLSGYKYQIEVQRKIDPSLLDLNKKGFLNGHTPFSAYLAFLSILCAQIFDYKNIVVSNEKSSNEENIEYNGRQINHQFSKSFAFEKQFREYIEENLTIEINYFSVLRPLYEIQISKIFSKHQKYFEKFKSCNVGQKNNTWCGKCAKCLSIYISLYPFVGKIPLVEIFGQDLYEKENLVDLLDHLAGTKTPKPFECVGTYEEVLLGLKLSIEMENEELPKLLTHAKDNYDFADADEKILSNWDENNFLPQDIAAKLKELI